MDETGENEDYDEQEPEEGQANDRPGKLRGLRGVANKLNNGLKNTLKQGRRALADGIKNVFTKKMILKFAIFLLAFVGVLACFWYVISDYNVKAAVTTTDSFFSADNALSNVSSAEVIEFYNTNGSLLLATSEDISKISTEYLTDIESKAALLYKYLSKTDKIGSYDIPNIDTHEQLNFKNAYEYVLNAEKVNFNKVSWKKIVRGQDKGEVELSVDDKTGLKYPSAENDEKELKDFVTMLRPYMQSWVISLSMFSGVATETTDEKIANYIYRIVNDASHKINVEQHTLQTIMRYKTTDSYRTKDYTIKKYYKDVSHTECDEDGNCVEVVDRIYGYLLSDLKTSISPDEGIELKTEEIDIDSQYKNADKSKKDSIDYVISNAELFDNVSKSIYKVEQYNQGDVNNMENYDTSSVVKRQEYVNITGLGGCQQILGLGSWEYDSEITYNVRDGEKTTYEFQWKDKRIAEKNVNRTYTMSDVISYIKTGEIIDSTADNYDELKGNMLSSSDLNSEETEYYKKIEEDEEINKIDLINSKEEIFKDYVLKGEFSKNIGYSRKRLSDSYRLLEKYLSEMVEKYAIRLKYGKTIVEEVQADYSYGGTYYGFIWPVPEYVEKGYGMWEQITSTFGLRTNPLSGKPGNNHTGIDISKGGSPDIVASKDGEVVVVKQYSAKGVESGGLRYTCYNKAC